MDNEPHILFDDRYLAVLQKPHGLQCEPDKNGHPDLCTFLRRHYNRANKPPKILQPVNRLDRPVGGIVLFAKTATALRELNRQQEAREIEKRYRALVEGIPQPAEAILKHFLVKYALEKRAEIFTEFVPGAKACELRYKTLAVAGDTSRLDIELKTGRYHQIRAQLAFTGHPIVGDAYYGAHTPYAPDAICLHAYSLRFRHPVTGEALAFVSEPAF